MLGSLHTISSIARHASQPRRKERSSAKCAAAGPCPALTACQTSHNAVPTLLPDIHNVVYPTSFHTSCLLPTPFSGAGFSKLLGPLTGSRLMPPTIVYPPCPASSCGKNAVAFFRHVVLPPLCWHFVSQVGPKTSQGAKRVPKRSPKAHFWEARVGLLGAIAPKVARCENISIYYSLAAL